MTAAGDIRAGQLHIDGASGAAGDMFLGAALDLGVPPAVIRAAIGALGSGLDLRIEPALRGGVAATDVAVLAGGEKVEDSGHGHGHGHGHGRHYAEIRAQIEAAGLDPPVRDRALDIFDRIARAEAQLHGTDVDRVHFHELGALDALADVVGAAAALEWLAPVAVSAAPVAVGGGLVRSAHGKLPVPAPATLEILREVGAPIVAGDIGFELCTPTGAAVLASAVTSWRPPVSMVPVAVGYGAGDRELDDRPNVLRLIAGRPPEPVAEMILYEANIDDMSPELAAHAAAAISDAGAVDVWWTPMTTKKSRPGWVLSVLAPAPVAAQIERTVFSETSTIGVRRRPVDRVIADREVVEVETRYGTAAVKVARIAGRQVNAAPEFERCAALARAAGVGLRAVYSAALAAWSER